jgi:PAT family beta-lactamase induction signal transducer AmpG
MPGKLISALSGRVVEGAAQASNGGYLSFITPWFSNLPADAFVEGAEKLGVAPANLAAGYATFFFYSALIGIVGVVAAFVIANGRAREVMEKRAAPA